MPGPPPFPGTSKVTLRHHKCWWSFLLFWTKDWIHQGSRTNFLSKVGSANLFSGEVKAHRGNNLPWPSQEYLTVFFLTIQKRNAKINIRFELKKTNFKITNKLVNFFFCFLFYICGKSIRLFLTALLPIKKILQSVNILSS